jgi:predicted nucleotidyltransferase component of viral defense system
MIPRTAIIEWSTTHPWQTAEQVEQDLLLSRAICAIAVDRYLAKELTFRGGTALHKLHLARSRRYSEDLDYVRSTAGGIGQVLNTLRDIGQDLGFATRSALTEHPKVFWRTMSESGHQLRIKIEINTHERSPALPLVYLVHEVKSSWWNAKVNVRTFQPAELIATKLRALYQRSKGRDLFDMWLALTEAQLDPAEVLTAFRAYRPDGYTSARAISNLAAKLQDHDFRHDVDHLVTFPAEPYDIDAAAAIVTEQLLARL